MVQSGDRRSVSFIDHTCAFNEGSHSVSLRIALVFTSWVFLEDRQCDILSIFENHQLVSLKDHPRAFLEGLHGHFLLNLQSVNPPWICFEDEFSVDHYSILKRSLLLSLEKDRYCYHWKKIVIAIIGKRILQIIIKYLRSTTVKQFFWYNHIELHV